MLSRAARELVELGFEEVGHFSKRGTRLNLFLSKYKPERGCYAFVADDGIKYVGVTKHTLSGRMNSYKNPGLSQQTNKRVNPKIKRAREVKIFFIPESRIKEFRMSIRHGKLRKDAMLDPITFERIMIYLIQPPWNRE